jgi:hypothetical protein
MAATVAAAFPFIDVVIDTSQLTPVAQRSPGVVAIVGSTAGDGTAPAKVPIVVDTPADAAQFVKITAGVVKPNPLYNALLIAMLQDPRPARIYAVRIDAATDFDAGLAALDGADDVTFVSLAGVTDLPTLVKLKAHAEINSASGQKRIAVVMVDPAIAKTATYAADLNTAFTGATNMKSSTSRVLVVAARGAVTDTGLPADVAAAAMAAVAGYAPNISVVLKRVRGINVPIAAQYTPAEIKALSEFGFVPIIQPAMIVGGGFFFGEGRLFTSDANLLYVDTVRTLDDIDFRLKAGLIGVIGDARITKAGLTSVKTRVDGILGPLQRGAIIDGYSVDIPVLNVLSVPDTTWTVAERQLVVDARANRIVDMFVSVTYGPAVHRLRVTLQPKF